MKLKRKLNDIYTNMFCLLDKADSKVGVVLKDAHNSSIEKRLALLQSSTSHVLKIAKFDIL